MIRRAAQKKIKGSPATNASAKKRKNGGWARGKGEGGGNRKNKKQTVKKYAARIRAFEFGKLVAAPRRAAIMEHVERAGGRAGGRAVNLRVESVSSRPASVYFGPST